MYVCVCVCAVDVCVRACTHTLACPHVCASTCVQMSFSQLESKILAPCWLGFRIFALRLGFRFSVYLD